MQLKRFLVLLLVMLPLLGARSMAAEIDENPHIKFVIDASGIRLSRFVKGAGQSPFENTTLDEFEVLLGNQLLAQMFLDDFRKLQELNSLPVELSVIVQNFSPEWKMQAPMNLIIHATVPNPEYKEDIRQIAKGARGYGDTYWGNSFSEAIGSFFKMRIFELGAEIQMYAKLQRVIEQAEFSNPLKKGELYAAIYNHYLGHASPGSLVDQTIRSISKNSASFTKKVEPDSK